MSEGGTLRGVFSTQFWAQEELRISVLVEQILDSLREIKRRERSNSKPQLIASGNSRQQASAVRHLQS